MPRQVTRATTTPLTIYPNDDVRDAIKDISRDDHERPLCKVVDMAVRAFAVLYARDKYEAMKLVDAFGQPQSGK